MWECRKSYGQTIIPIFYDISPTDVKGQAGDFERYFNQHEIDGVDSNTIETWKEVLRQVGGLSGYDRENINGGYISQLIIEVAARVSQELKKGDKNITEVPVGIDLPVQEVMRKLGVVYSDGQAVKVPDKDVRVVGICGMLGVGKTTLAKVVFNKMHMWFDACSFLQGISSESIQLLQHMLISDLLEKETAPLKSSGEGIEKMASLFGNRRVLIVLDDVHEDEQIKALAGNLNWFGPGSRIIVTTEKRNVLNAFNVGAVEEYKMEPMRDYHSLQLFRKHVFLGHASQDVSEYDSLSIDIVRAVGGLPLAIVHHASYLRRNMNIDTWRSTLEFLKKHPEDRV
ncbi:TMV resistance protein N-like [Eucalyptus grandis]|uniref:TMV resistance protein N-like n=1 Tax=Eucalyptus grandis TaxID=71139 RepID=UPI00192EA8B6|nr:TMV resistance protein N-like [Eucalyptus grandis]